MHPDDSTPAPRASADPRSPVGTAGAAARTLPLRTGWVAAAALTFSAVCYGGYAGWRALATSAGASPSAAKTADAAATTDAALRLLRQDPEIVKQGAAVFETQCAACHGLQGAGSVGPNLTDKNWLHGGTPHAIFKAVAEGIPARGMPGWQALLGTERVRQVTAFVLSLRNTQLPGKPAQGEEYTGD